MLYEVTVEETCSQTWDVEADSFERAVIKAQDLYNFSNMFLMDNPTLLEAKLHISKKDDPDQSKEIKVF